MEGAKAKLPGLSRRCPGLTPCSPLQDAKQRAHEQQDTSRENAGTGQSLADDRLRYTLIQHAAEVFVEDDELVDLLHRADAGRDHIDEAFARNEPQISGSDR